MRARDKFIVIALIGLMVVVSGAAVAIDRAETKTVVPTYGGTYVEGVTSAAQFLNPVLAATPVDDDVVRLVFSGLSRFRSDGSIQGDLAQSFAASDDGKVWTFQIRDDARGTTASRSSRMTSSTPSRCCRTRPTSGPTAMRSAA